MHQAERLLSSAALMVFSLTSCIQEVKDPGFGETFANQYVSGTDTCSWRKMDLGPTGYTRLAVDPLAFGRFHLGWYQGVPADGLGVAREAYEEVLRAVLGRDYPFVAPGGPPAPSGSEGTLRVSASLTDRITARELLSGAGAGRLATDPSGSLPGVALEIRFRDASSGELVAAFVSVADAPTIQRNLLQPTSAESWSPVFLPPAQRLKVALDAARLGGTGSARSSPGGRASGEPD
jgi:hypothetical protein